jgi:hypothetical protein
MLIYISSVDGLMVLIVAVEVMLYYLQSFHTWKFEYKRGAK